MIDLVIGGQYGSEGKGSVVSWMVAQKPYKAVIKVGGHQAGHTMDYNEKRFKMRMIPCGWHTGAELVIGEGSVIDEDVLLEEIEMVSDELGVAPEELPLSISPMATVCEQAHKDIERGLDMRDRIGSTGEGVGWSRAMRAMRVAKTMGESNRCRHWVRESRWLSDPTADILIESSQGFALSVHSHYYPFVSSADVNPYSVLSGAGIHWGVQPITVYGVLRTFPIRVGGNSGFLPHETTWEELQWQYGKHIPIERTTVTNRVRRVGFPDWGLVREFEQRCHPDKIFLTFVDYLAPELANEDGEINAADVSHITFLEDYFAICQNLAYLGTGVGHFLRIVGR